MVANHSNGRLVFKIASGLVCLIMFFLLMGVVYMTINWNPTYRATTTIGDGSTNFPKKDQHAIDHINDVNAQVRVIASRDMAMRVVKTLELNKNQAFLGDFSELQKENETDVIALLQGCLRVQPMRDANSIAISIDHSQPRIAEALCYAYANAYVQYRAERYTAPLLKKLQDEYARWEKLKNDLSLREKRIAELKGLTESERHLVSRKKLYNDYQYELREANAIKSQLDELDERRQERVKEPIVTLCTVDSIPTTVTVRPLKGYLQYYLEFISGIAIILTIIAVLLRHNLRA